MAPGSGAPRRARVDVPPPGRRPRTLAGPVQVRQTSQGARARAARADPLLHGVAEAAPVGVLRQVSVQIFRAPAGVLAAGQMDGVRVPASVERHVRVHARAPAPSRGRGARAGVRAPGEIVRETALEGRRASQVGVPAALLNTGRPRVPVLLVQAEVGVPVTVGRAARVPETVRVVQAAVAVALALGDAGSVVRAA